MSKTITMSILTLVSMLAMACQATPPSSTPEVQTVVVNVTVEKADTFVTEIVAATPIPQPPRTLTICVIQEPANLFIYGENSGKNKNNILDAIYDGPVDTISYDYQPVILEELPTFKNGGARLQAVVVNPGGAIVDSAGNVTSLSPGVQFHPAGCNEHNCAATYTEGQGRIMMDQMEVTFTLLPGLLWSDGAPLRATDSIFSFNLASNPEIPTEKNSIDRTSAYRAVDAQTVRWTGLPGYKDPNYASNFWAPLPEHLWRDFSPMDLLNASGSTLIPIGWGPYQIEEWLPGDHIRLSKNPHYFRANEGLPKFDYLIYQFVPDDPSLNIPKLLSGECDILEETPQLFEQGELLLAMAERNQLQAIFSSKSAWEHIDFGIVPVSYDNGWTLSDDRPDIFGDARTRQAVAFCMDREKVVETVMLGQSVVLDSYLPRQHPLFNPDVAQYDFDPQAGSALLEEVGWVDTDGDPATPRTYAGDHPHIPAGTPLSFNFWTSTTPHRQQAVQLLAQSMYECGIQANIQFWSTGEYFIEGPDGPIFGRRFDLGQLGWLADVQPLCELYLTDWIPGNVFEINPYLGQPFLSWQAPNISGFSNPGYDSACRKALSSLPGQTSYTENHLEAQKIFSAELPAIPLYLQMKVAAARVDLCNFTLNPTSLSDFFNLEAFDYGKGCGE